VDRGRLIDISQPVDPSIGTFPGDTPFSWEFTWSLAAGDSCNVSRVVTSPHNGTHADAPLHFEDGATGIGDVELDRYVGPCWVVDGPREGLLQPEHLRSIDVDTYPRLLVRTRDDARTGFPDEFSHGMRKRLSLARAALDDPPLFLLDEPSRRLFGINWFTYNPQGDKHPYLREARAVAGTFVPRS